MTNRGKRVLVAIDEFAKYSRGPIEILEENGLEVEINSTGRPLSFISDIEAYSNADYVIAGLEEYPVQFFERFENVGVISRVGVGVDCIDVSAAQEHGVKVFVTSDRPSVAVAELCVANMIALLRHTFTMSNALKSSVWNPIQGKELRSCTVGIVGMGSIGKEVARRAHAFGSRVIGYSRTWNREFSSEFDIERKTLDKIFLESDIITIHLPLTIETRNLINSELINSTKPGALIINTSRAGVMDNGAVAQALKSRHLGGAAVDVFEEERDPRPYGNLSNVILTPHIGSHTLETRKAMEEMAATNIVMYDRYLQSNEDIELREYINSHSVLP